MSDETPPSPAEQARLGRKRRRRERRREDILEAAGELLRREGVAGFTIAAVAREADVSKPAVYYYFADRQALVSALARQVFDREIAHCLGVIAAAPDGLSAMAAHLKARVALYADDLDGYRLVFLWPQVFGVDRALLTEHVLPEADRVTSALEARLLEDRAAGRLHPDVHPRKLLNVEFATTQGILNMVSSMEMMGDNTRFTALALAEEAAASLVRGARAPGWEAASVEAGRGSGG